MILFIPKDWLDRQTDYVVGYQIFLQFRDRLDLSKQEFVIWANQMAAKDPVAYVRHFFKHCIDNLEIST
jgi:hypothetical protein